MRHHYYGPAYSAGFHRPARLTGVIAILVLVHLVGGAFHHRRHGPHPNLYHTYDRGW
jgi:hypothetical protein